VSFRGAVDLEQSKTTLLWTRVTGSKHIKNGRLTDQYCYGTVRALLSLKLLNLISKCREARAQPRVEIEMQPGMEFYMEINEHFERGFNEVLPSAVILR
jgi:hypothetical protein